MALLQVLLLDSKLPKTKGEILFQAAFNDVIPFLETLGVIGSPSSLYPNHLASVIIADDITGNFKCTCSLLTVDVNQVDQPLTSILITDKLIDCPSEHIEHALHVFSNNQFNAVMIDILFEASQYISPKEGNEHVLKIQGREMKVDVEIVNIAFVSSKMFKQLNRRHKPLLLIV